MSPAIIIVPGFGYPVGELDELIKCLARNAQVAVFQYDSEQAKRVSKESRSGTPLVSALVQFCTHLSVGSDLILLGHSFGGLLAHLVERQQRVKIDQMILIDPMTKCQFSVLPPLLPPAATGESMSLSKFRLFIESAWKEPSSNRYSVDIPPYLELLREPRLKSTTDVTLISANSFAHDSPGIFPEPYATRLQLAWLDLHCGILREFLRNQLVIARNSNHYVHRCEPQVIISQVNAALGRMSARDG